MNQMKVIILAGGEATRLPNSAKDIPKSLVKVQGRAILDHQLELLANHGLYDVRLALGFRADQIIDYIAGRPQGRASLVHGVSRAGKYEYVIEPEPLGTGGAVKFASRDLEEPFIVMNGDILTNLDLKEFLNHHRTAAGEGNTIAVYEVENAQDFGLLKLEGNQILKFQEKPSESRPGFINAGFYILRPDILKNFPKKNFSMEIEIFPQLAQDRKLFYYLHQGLWTDLGTEARLAEVNQINQAV